MADQRPSGEIQVLILDLLKEQRSDMKSIAANTQATALDIAEIKGDLRVGKQVMDDHTERIKALENARPCLAKIKDDESSDDYRPSSTKRKAVKPAAEADTETLKGKRKPQDYGLWIKIGLLIGAAAAGAMAGKAVP